MRVECEACRQLVEASFDVEGDAVRVSCPACGHASRAPLMPAREPSGPLCPKCGARRSEASTSCASCGLASARMAAFGDALDASVPLSVREAWARAAADWGDAARHDELLRAAAAHNSYAWVAGRYRARGHDPVAARQLDRLRRAAEATLFAGATVRREPTARPYRSATGLLAILIAAITVGLIYTSVARHRGARPIAPATPVQPLVPGHPVSPSTIR